MRIRAILMAVLLLPLSAHAGEGMVTLDSPYGVGKTMDRLEQIVRDKGFRVFDRIDHAKGAQGVGLKLRPTQLLIFGNPKKGTLMMQSNQTAAIDLPMKYLVWQDAAGKVQVGWNDPAWMAARHHITDRAKLVQGMTGALKTFATLATQ